MSSRSMMSINMDASSAARGVMGELPERAFFGEIDTVGGTLCRQPDLIFCLSNLTFFDRVSCPKT